MYEEKKYINLDILVFLRGEVRRGTWFGSSIYTTPRSKQTAGLVSVRGTISRKNFFKLVIGKNIKWVMKRILPPPPSARLGTLFS